MLHRRHLIKGSLWLAPVALIGFAACGPSEEIQRQLAELQAVSAEKDSLLVQVADNARLMSEISAEVARVQTAGDASTQEVAGSPDPERLRESIKSITTRLEESETRLAESQRRIQALTRESRNNQTRVAELQKAIEDFQSTIANQKLTIESLNEQIANLQTQNTELVAQNTELATRVDSIAMRVNTVYYIVGTKDELLERGIIEEEGGSRVLFVFGKRGKTIVPRRDLDLTQFNTMDLATHTDIVLPDPEKQYRIVSRQDIAALATPPDEDGRFQGEIKIADPERFWATSKVLIIVQS